MLVLTEEEWFDEYYPKEWGDWRQEYNAKAYRENGVIRSGCTWLNYKVTGWLAGSNDLLVVNKHSDCRYIKSSLFEVSDDICTMFCGPRQPDGSCWVQGTIYKCESNLELYTITLFGIDDMSYSKDFIGLDSVLEGWDKLPQLLTDMSLLFKDSYYFTN